MPARALHGRIVAEVIKMVKRLAPGARAAGIWEPEEVMSRVRHIDDAVRRPLGLSDSEEGRGRKLAFEADRYNRLAVFEDIMERVYELGEMLVPGATTSGNWVPRKVEDMFGDISDPLAEALGLRSTVVANHEVDQEIAVAMLETNPKVAHGSIMEAVAEFARALAPEKMGTSEEAQSHYWRIDEKVREALGLATDPSAGSSRGRAFAGSRMV
jgi:hypothetical protein